MPQQPASPPTNGEYLYLTPAEVSARLRGRITVKTLANWRCPSGRGDGPPYLRAGGRILYPVAKLAEWEKARLQHQRKPYRRRRSGSD